MLLYGKILAVVRGKPVLLVAITIFMAGSLICALANTIQLLIFGRVIAGAGGGGIYVAVLSILAQVVSHCFEKGGARAHSLVDCSVGEEASISRLLRCCLCYLQYRWATPWWRFLRYVSSTLAKYVSFPKQDHDVT